MSEQAEQNSQNNEIIKLILEALQVPVKIANQIVGSVLLLALVNIASGAWLSFISYQTFSGNASLTGFIFLLIACPSLLLAKLYLTLKEIIGLPDQIVIFFQTSSRKVAELNQAQERVRNKLKDANWRVDNLIREKEWQASDVISATKNAHYGLSLWKRLRNYFALARRLRDVKSLISEFEGLATLTAGAMLLANPLFLTIVTISIGVTLIWALVTIVTFLFYIL